MGGELGAQAVANPTAFGIACSIDSLAPGTCLNGFITKSYSDGAVSLLDNTAAVFATQKWAAVRMA